MSFTMDFKMFNKTFFPLVDKKILSASEKGLINAAKQMNKDAREKAPQVPKKKGDLRGSWEMEKPKTTRNEISITVGYNIDYATKQHEAEPEQFNYTKNKGAAHPGPKFLQKKIVGYKKKYIEIVALTIANTKV